MATPYVKQTWIDGDTTKPASAARFGVMESGIFDAHYHPSVAVHRSGVQSIPTGAGTIVLWDVEDYDTDSMHSTVTNTGRLTAPVAGKYHIEGRVGFATNATGFRQCNIRQSGTTVWDTDTDWAPTASGICYLHVSKDLLLSAADYVELIASHNSGGALNIGGAIEVLNFQMHCFSY